MRPRRGFVKCGRKADISAAVSTGCSMQISPTDSRGRGAAARPGGAAAEESFASRCFQRVGNGLKWGGLALEGECAPLGKGVGGKFAWQVASLHRMLRFRSCSSAESFEAIRPSSRYLTAKLAWPRRPTCLRSRTKTFRSVGRLTGPCGAWRGRGRPEHQVRSPRGRLSCATHHWCRPRCQRRLCCRTSLAAAGRPRRVGAQLRGRLARPLHRQPKVVSVPGLSDYALDCVRFRNEREDQKTVVTHRLAHAKLFRGVACAQPEGHSAYVGGRQGTHKIFLLNCGVISLPGT